ncbi:acyl-CoA dehydrogenase family protein [Actinopolymorpha pittospori]|uniref:Alkylation response protein AidB-like acyl-CoA dehydrogenase n=1 Tax=Actinopolymorpha pittospori TaxID=648752 RepID=A0A927ND45_9ACTN|nr:acyl-CoA dehydrogenase family protein [Actinopolymorpha pittospori]MBE1612655.1 alkylation response protein AidB-like acyl-CoA dehydrogenase [Actinopolymorpha pittospori]
MPVVERLLPTPEAHDLLELTREIAAEQLAPRAAEAEAASRFPRDVFRLLGQAGLLSLPYPEEYGGGGQPFEVYLQVLEELAAAWLSVAVGTSVQSLACYPLAHHGTQEQRERWLPRLLSGDLLGAYCLSEPQAGSDVTAMTTRATRTEPESGYVVNGTKAWITHGSEADFYTLFARTSTDRTRGMSCFLVDADTPGLGFATPEHKMGLTASTTTQVHWDDVRVDADRLISAEGDGLRIALSALDSGRLGIAACAVGLAQAALDAAVDYARQRTQFGQPVISFQGLSFLLADMAAGVQAARATYLDAARRRDRGMAYSTQAAVAKLTATDMAMKVTTDAVQVLGGYGYTRDFPVERYMREAKVLQIFEGTNQVQRLVIGRALAG